MRITRNQLRQIIQEETGRLNEQGPPDAKMKAAIGLMETGKFFYNGTQEMKSQWENKAAFLQGLEEARQNLPALIEYIEGLEGDTWDEILGTWYWQSNR